MSRFVFEQKFTYRLVIEYECEAGSGIMNDSPAMDRFCGVACERSTPAPLRPRNKEQGTELDPAQSAQVTDGVGCGITIATEGPRSRIARPVAAARARVRGNRSPSCIEPAQHAMLM